MSYLEMPRAPLPDMNKGIISLWFREFNKQASAPKPDKWPDGVWHEGTDSMVPPDVYKIVQNHPSNVFWWSAYGLVNAFFGTALLGPAPVLMPVPPYFTTDNMRMLLTWGNPNQSYNYYPWKIETLALTQYVKWKEGIVGLPLPWKTTDWPPPYAPYNPPFYSVANMKLENSPTVKPNFVPQSFIAVDKDGYLTICLQTNTNADYKGYAFQLAEIKDLWAAGSEMIAPDINDVNTWYFTLVPGYWNGYEFQYEDISNKIFGAQPETFVIGGGVGGGLELSSGPRVTGNTWHHVLFSFDISGSVTLKCSEKVNDPPAAMSTTCKAWLAVDDVNQTGATLQRRLSMPNQLGDTVMEGIGYGTLLPTGPSTAFKRFVIEGTLGPNGIIPQNTWIRPYGGGNPKDGLAIAHTYSGLSNGLVSYGSPEGDFQALSWSGVLNYHYSQPIPGGRSGVPGPWLAVLDPPRPTVTDPATFDVPTYKCDSFNIPVEGFPIGIPTAARHLKHNTGVEMGELQIWANKTLDTADIKMRRLFVDEHGKPVPPEKAEEALGRPDILLHGENNWKSGRNTGKSGTTDDKEIISAGQFIPVAKIENFLPNPELNK